MKHRAIFTVSLLTLSLTINGLAFADDQLYYPPAELHNCARSTHGVSCEFFAPFLEYAMIQDNGTDSLNGDYQFEGAHTTTDVPVGFYTYKNKNNNRIVLTTGFYSLIQPALENKNTKWEKIPDPYGFLNCSSSKPADCPFTHTPWHYSLQPIQPNTVITPPSIKNLPTANAKNVRTISLTPQQQNPLQAQNEILITNESDHWIKAHIDDFNSASLSFKNPLVPPHTKNFPIGFYKRLSNQTLMFDLQISDEPRLEVDSRNTQDTTVFIIDDEDFRWINLRLFVYNQTFWVMAESLGVDPLTGNITIDVTVDKSSK